MTVAQSILRDLRHARDESDGWWCGSVWYATFRPTFAQRISLDLKPHGYVIESRPCRRHDHNSTIHEYRLLGEPARSELATNKGSVVANSVRTGQRSTSDAHRRVQRTPEPQVAEKPVRTTEQLSLIGGRAG